MVLPAARIEKAVKTFWQTRNHQKDRQGRTGKADQGNRGAVTGGGQLDGFIELVRELLEEAGVPPASIFTKTRRDIPGFYRASKEWDLLVIHDGALVAAIEFKSQVGSFGNNFNNRTEEAIGSATDIWTAFREGAFQTRPRPWLGFFMMLENAPTSLRPVRNKESHFPVFDEFRDASYTRRYEILCEKLVRERLYDATCLLTSEKKTGSKGRFGVPQTELAFEGFVTSLLNHTHSCCTPR